MLSRYRVRQMQGGDHCSGVAILLENFDQFLGQLFVRHVGLTKGRKHRSHRALRHAEPMTSLRNSLVRSLRRGFDKRPYLLGRKPN